MGGSTLLLVLLVTGLAVTLLFCFVTNRRLRQAREKMLEATRNQQLAVGVFANSADGMLITDANHLILDANPAFTRITGYSRAEVLGLNPSFLGSDAKSSDLYQEIWTTVALSGSWRGEVWNRRKNGEVFVESLSISVVRDDSGEITHHIGIFSDITGIKEQAAELERVAHYDDLTGLPNRRLLMDRIHQAIARSRRTKSPVALCYLDLDDFKPVNDRFGHEAGDEVLIEVAQRLQSQVRAVDTVCRLGGDEFVLLLGEIEDRQALVQILERILASIIEPICLGLGTVQVSASIGVAVYPDDLADPDTLMRHADQMMYEAKKAGRNRYQMYCAD